MATIYHLMRSLACELPHEASREYLVNYFEQIRQKLLEKNQINQQLQLQGNKGKKNKDFDRQNNNLQRDDKYFLNFILTFFRV